jgi:hypothetical protein
MPTAKHEPQQVEKFRQLARELGADEEGETAFDERLKKLATAPPQHREKPKKP